MRGDGAALWLPVVSIAPTGYRRESAGVALALRDRDWAGGAIGGAGGGQSEPLADGAGLGSGRERFSRGRFSQGTGKTARRGTGGKPTRTSPMARAG